MDKIKAYQARIDSVLDSLLPVQNASDSRLYEAMRYSVLNGGKRVRPLLVYASGEALKLLPSRLDHVAAAVELIHAYSLIHDDLPAMDDDALRRGKPTSHIAFDEATAILAGDALQTLAFQVLAEPVEGVESHNQLKIIRELSLAAGAYGMVNGQAVDLAAVGKALNEQQLENMHRQKTGALIKSSVIMPTYVSGNVTREERNKLSSFADAIGLAFQVHDDILDIESDTKTLGKQQGADRDAGKPTYPSILGIEAAKQKAQKLYDDALDSLEPFAENAELLRQIAGFIVKRNS